MSPPEPEPCGLGLPPRAETNPSRPVFSTRYELPHLLAARAQAAIDVLSSDRL